MYEIWLNSRKTRDMDFYLVMHHLEDDGEFHFGYPMAYTEP